MSEPQQEMYERKSYLENLKRMRGTEKVRDPAWRRLKAHKVLAVLEDFAARSGRRLADLHALDIGCGGATVAAELSKHFASVTGLDTDQVAVPRAAAIHSDRRNLRFLIGSAMCLPLADASFDVVICNQVYEHLPSAETLVAEIGRVLKPDGFCYFSAGSKYKIIEHHYKLPFLSWLPRRLADLYVRALGRGRRYEERHYSWWQLKRLLRDFDVADYTVRLIKEPETFRMTELVRPGSLLSRMPRGLLNLLEPASPTFVFVISHPGGAGA